METPVCHVCIPFEARATAVARTRFFYAFLDARDQRTPGRMVIVTHQHIPALTAWTDEYWIEFGQFERALERALKEALDPTEPQKLINLECKMNLARAEGTHTHWHMLPRYRNAITLTDPDTGEAVIFHDCFFGQPYDFNSKNYHTVSPALMSVIIKKIQEKLDLSGIAGAQCRSV
jgi:diadenosine tetraphosphate (Ap4A) HIT family hydrolase